jgi:hypothetical protein
VPQGGAPVTSVTPQLPFGADLGTITGWLLDETLTQILRSFLESLEHGFNQLVDNIPVMGDPGHNDAMRIMTNKITNSDTLVAHLTASNIQSQSMHATTIHSIACYRAGFGGSNAWHRKMLALLREVMGTQLHQYW